MGPLGERYKKGATHRADSPDRVDHVKGGRTAARINFRRPQISRWCRKSVTKAEDADCSYTQQPGAKGDERHTGSHQQKSEDQGKAIPYAFDHYARKQHAKHRTEELGKNQRSGFRIGERPTRRENGKHGTEKSHYDS